MQKLKGLMAMTKKDEYDTTDDAVAKDEQWFGMRRRYAMRRPRSALYARSPRGKRGQSEKNDGEDSDEDVVYRYAVQVPDEDTGVWDMFYELPPHLRDDKQSKFLKQEI